MYMYYNFTPVFHMYVQVMPKVVRATKAYTGGSSDSSVAENEILIIKNSKSKLTGVCLECVQSSDQPLLSGQTNMYGTCSLVSNQRPHLQVGAPNKLNSCLWPVGCGVQVFHQLTVHMLTHLHESLSPIFLDSRCSACIDEFFN